MKINSKHYLKTLFDYTIILMYTFFFTGVTFVGNIEQHVETINNLIENNNDFFPFYIESPTLLLIASYLKISHINNLSVFLFLFLLFLLFLIVITSQFLGNLNYIILFSGWIITINWWVGYVDIIIVLATLGILKYLIQNPNNPIIFLFCLLASFSHFPIYLFVLVNIFILFKEKLNLRSFLYISSGVIIGLILNQLFLSSLNIVDSKRLWYIISNETISKSIMSLANNNIFVFYSGFSASFLIFVCFTYFSYLQKKDYLLKIYFSIFISLSCTSLGLDTSRIFSIVIISLIVWIIVNLESFKKEKYFKQIMYSSFLVAFLVGPIHVWDNNVYFNSPFEDFSIFKYLLIQAKSMLGI